MLVTFVIIMKCVKGRYVERIQLVDWKGTNRGQFVLKAISKLRAEIIP